MWGPPLLSCPYRQGGGSRPSPDVPRGMWTEFSDDRESPRLVACRSVKSSYLWTSCPDWISAFIPRMTAVAAISTPAG